MKIALGRCHWSHRNVCVDDSPHCPIALHSRCQVAILSEAIKDNKWDAENGWRMAIQSFSDRRAADAQALVRISHALDGNFFVPLIVVDSVFHKLFPSVFRPNMIRMLQNDAYRFTETEKIKTRERIVQWSLLAIVFSAVIRFLYACVRLIWFHFAV